MDTLETSAAEELYTYEGVMAAAGITYRQLDHWTRTGQLHPIVPSPGSGGGVRRYPQSELDVARAAADLIRAGFHTRRAISLARLLVGLGRAEIRVGAVTVTATFARGASDA